MCKVHLNYERCNSKRLLEELLTLKVSPGWYLSKARKFCCLEQQKLPKQSRACKDNKDDIAQRHHRKNFFKFFSVATTDVGLLIALETLVAAFPLPWDSAASGPPQVAWVSQDLASKLWIHTYSLKTTVAPTFYWKGCQCPFQCNFKPIGYLLNQNWALYWEIRPVIL